MARLIPYALGSLLALSLGAGIADPAKARERKPVEFTAGVNFDMWTVQAELNHLGRSNSRYCYMGRTAPPGMPMMTADGTPNPLGLTGRTLKSQLTLFSLHRTQDGMSIMLYSAEGRERPSELRLLTDLRLDQGEPWRVIAQPVARDNYEVTDLPSDLIDAMRESRTLTLDVGTTRFFVSLDGFSQALDLLNECFDKLP